MERSPITHNASFNSGDSVLDSDFEFFDPLHPDGGQKLRSAQPNKIKPRERGFYARLGALALAAAIVAAPATTRESTPRAATETESSDFSPEDAFKPVAETVETSPAMAWVSAMKQDNESAPEIEEELVALPEKEPPIIVFSPSETPAKTAPVEDTKSLNAHDGRVHGPSGEETFYNLPMDTIVKRMHDMGIKGDYWVREDGVKMLGDYVMVAANLTTHPRGSIVETSLGPGIVCDTGDFAKDHPHRLDIATNW